jgi:hypothetical protein
MPIDCSTISGFIPVADGFYNVFLIGENRPARLLCYTPPEKEAVCLQDVDLFL